jgi:hypothetical protein
MSTTREQLELLSWGSPTMRVIFLRACAENPDADGEALALAIATMTRPKPIDFGEIAYVAFRKGTETSLVFSPWDVVPEEVRDVWRSIAAEVLLAALKNVPCPDCARLPCVCRAEYDKANP